MRALIKLSDIPRKKMEKEGTFNGTVLQSILNDSYLTCFVGADNRGFAMLPIVDGGEIWWAPDEVCYQSMIFIRFFSLGAELDHYKKI